MLSAWQTLLANLAVITITISVWSKLYAFLDKLSVGWMNVIFGVVCGATSVVVMMMPFEILPGVYFDLRVVPVVLAGFFCGPAAGILAAGASLLYRLSLGGAGLGAGTIAIILVTLIAVVLHRRRGDAAVSFGEVSDLAFGTAGGLLIASLTMPRNMQEFLFTYAALPVVTLTIVAILLAGTALMLDRRERAVVKANAIYRSIIDALPDCLNAKDAQGRFMVVNPATARLMGVEDTQMLIGQTDAAFYSAETAGEFRLQELDILALGQPRTLEQKFFRSNGQVAWLSTLKVPFPSLDGSKIGLITHNRDITAQKQMEFSLAEAQQRLSDALTHMADGLVMFDADRKLVYSSSRFRTMFAIPDHVMLPGMSFGDVLAQAAHYMKIELPPSVTAADWIKREESRISVLEATEFGLPDGRWFLTRHAKVLDGGWLTVFSDITDRKHDEQQLMSLNARLEVLARTDGLTNLANRKTFDEQLYTEFARSMRHGNSLGLLMADVDHFKAYNDTYGHPEGDACLTAIAECLRNSAKRPNDLVARYGGEEFVAIFPEVGEAGMEIVAEHFRQSVMAMQRPHAGSPKGIVTISIGIAVMEGTTELNRPAELLREADAALYRAKGAGRNCVRFAELPIKHNAQSTGQQAS